MEQPKNFDTINYTNFIEDIGKRNPCLLRVLIFCGKGNRDDLMKGIIDGFIIAYGLFAPYKQPFAKEVVDVFNEFMSTNLLDQRIVTSETFDYLNRYHHHIIEELKKNSY
jgi:hypothetical protein